MNKEPMDYQLWKALKEHPRVDVVIVKKQLDVKEGRAWDKYFYELARKSYLYEKHMFDFHGEGYEESI